jgi:hypothetical protein
MNISYYGRFYLITEDSILMVIEKIKMIKESEKSKNNSEKI